MSSPDMSATRPTDRPGVPPPVSLRISLTDRCQLRCRYCMPPQGVTPSNRDDVLRYEEIARFVAAVQQCRGVEKVRLTGGEPLIRSSVEQVVEMIAALAVPDLALTTNAQRLAPMAATLKDAGLRRVNISLDSLDAATFAHLSRGGDLQRTLAGIDAAVAVGLQPVRLNTVVMRGINDHEIPRLATYALDRGCQLRFLELMPMGPATDEHAAHFVGGDEILMQLRERFELTADGMSPGGSSRNWHVRDAAGRTGRIGIITPYSAPFCRGCRRLRLTATGDLVGCLARGSHLPLRALLRAKGGQTADALMPMIEAALATKRDPAEPFATTRQMTATGG